MAYPSMNHITNHQAMTIKYLKRINIEVEELVKCVDPILLNKGQVERSTTMKWKDFLIEQQCISCIPA